MKIFILSLAVILIAIGIFLAVRPAEASNRLVMRNTSNTIVNQISVISSVVYYHISSGIVTDEISVRITRSTLR